MCRPVGVFWAEACPGGHIGPPLRGGEKFPQPTRPSCVEASAMGRDGARPLRGEREWTDGGVWSPRPTGATQVMPSNGPMWASAPTERRESHINHPGQRRTAKRLRRGREGWVEIGAGIIPEVSSNAGQSLSQPAADSSLCTREPFPAGDEGCGLPRRFAPRNDSPKPLSFRGGPTGRRGNPSFLRWTVVRAAEVVGPYGRSTEVPATGRCGHRPLRVVAGTAPRLPGQRLAKRKARG